MRGGPLEPTVRSRYLNPMTNQPTPPLSPWTMTPARITILVLGVLALIFIVGAIMGGVSNYQALKEASSEPPSAGDINAH
jgi:hypothetical protein